MAAAAAAAGWVGDLWTPARAAASRRTLAMAVNPAGTTLESSVMKPPGTGYRSLLVGPEYPIMLRQELATALPGREDRRQAVASIVHLTDVHVIDAQSPARVEFTDRLGGILTSAYRPQETLTTQVGTAMVHRINQVAAGPVCGREFDCAVSTGDNIDNQQQNELDWFIDILDGGSVVPDSGEMGRYEGVQDDGQRGTQGLLFYDREYWHPNAPLRFASRDKYKTTHGFPTIQGLLDDAIRGFTSPGLAMRWYSVYGNHDCLMQGNLNGVYPGGLRGLHPVSVGAIKPIVNPLPAPPTCRARRLSCSRSSPCRAVVRFVTRDLRRRSVSIPEWVQSHLNVPPLPGPSATATRPT